MNCGSAGGEATFAGLGGCAVHAPLSRSRAMNGIIYLVGLVVVIMAILSFFGLR
ncbi:hypothetical protein [Devosia sp.]|uniref:hypothetical protein n=1 Tax=Devosia sp. TaxID=1871048 RepID=UPI0035B2E1D9